MAARVDNPASPAASGLKSLGTAKYIVAGDYVVTPPPGARWLRMELRGGGGAGGIHTGAGASGGGEGAVQRRMVPIRAGAFVLTIGAGGSNGRTGQPPARASGASTMLGYTASPGAAGEGASNVAAAGGAGVDGVDPLVGYGNFSGSLSDGLNGGGANGAAFGKSQTATLGGGGIGFYSTTTPTPAFGTPGGDGYAFLEFFG
jgi:hypothetical protein